MPRMATINVKVRYKATWDMDGKCYVLVWFGSKLHSANRYPDGDQDPDPADYWKHPKEG